MIRAASLTWPPTASQARFIAESSISAVKHCFTHEVKHCLITADEARADNQAMLKSEMKSVWRAAKLRTAMQNAKPPIKQADLARTCGVTKQVVHGWLKTGRIDKKYLPALADVLGQPLEFLLEEDSVEQPAARFSRAGTYRVTEQPSGYSAKDKLLQAIIRDWPALSDIDRRRIYNDVTQKAEHVRTKIREHEQQSTARESAEASNESVINRVVGFIKRPRKPRS